MGTAYCASKAALNHFSRCVALEEASKGVRINTLSPGAIVTPVQATSIDPGLSGGALTDDPGLLEKVRSHEGLRQINKMGRLGEADEMAKLIAFIISDSNSYMTGSNVISDGGM